MKRRDLLAAVVGIGCTPTSFQAFSQLMPQRKGGPFRIVVMAISGPQFLELLSSGLKTRGWTEAKDFVVIVVPPELFKGFDSLEPMIAWAMDARPDLVIVGSTASAVAIQKRSSTLPIVMLYSGYPVEAGVADSLARPGRNVTGNSIYAGTGVWGKMLELLRESKPGIKRVGVLWGYVPPAFPRTEIEPAFAEFRKSATSLGLSLRIFEVPSLARLADAAKELVSERADALFASAWLTLGDDWTKVMEIVASRKLPVIIDFANSYSDARRAPLMSYSPDREELAKQAVSYVERILRGAKPGELPIQLPSRFELTVNLGAAGAIGLAVPKSILARADRVID